MARCYNRLITDNCFIYCDFPMVLQFDSIGCELFFVKSGEKFASFLKFNMGPMGASDIIRIKDKALPF